MGLDIRFASREKAIFGQPEVGTGLIPGGGALQRLPLLVGRARTLEIVLGADDYDAETAERYGWINRAIPDTDLDAFVANFVRRVVSFDRQALSTAKSIINASGLPDPAQLQATQDLFFKTFGWDGARERAPILRDRGIGQAGDFELRLGHHIGHLIYDGHATAVMIVLAGIASLSSGIRTVAQLDGLSGLGPDVHWRSSVVIVPGSPRARPLPGHARFGSRRAGMRPNRPCRAEAGDRVKEVKG